MSGIMVFAGIRCDSIIESANYQRNTSSREKNPPGPGKTHVCVLLVKERNLNMFNS